jgi:hypothetical protein
LTVDNMYRRRRLGPPLWVRLVLTLPPSILFPTLGFLYMVFFDHPRRPRPVLVTIAAPFTVLANTQDIGFAALLMLFNVLAWFSALNAIITGIGWIFETPDPPKDLGP